MLRIRRLIKGFCRDNRGLYQLIITVFLIILGAVAAINVGDDTSNQISDVNKVVGDKLDAIANDLAADETE